MQLDAIYETYHLMKFGDIMTKYDLYALKNICIRVVNLHESILPLKRNIYIDLIKVYLCILNKMQVKVIENSWKALRL